jgi:hypothetical protein
MCSTSEAARGVAPGRLAGKCVCFCCQPCVAEFRKDPDTYMKKLADAGETLEDAESCTHLAE